MSQALHRHTPSLTAYDPRGLAICAVAYHRRTAAQEPEARISRQVFGPSGFLTEQWDPRLAALRPQAEPVVPNQRNRHSLSGRLLHSDNVDRGVRISLCGAAAQLRFCWYVCRCTRWLNRRPLTPCSNASGHGALAPDGRGG